MRIAYLGNYNPEISAGGNAHVYQFIKNAVQLGHEVWTWPENNHPLARKLPNNSIYKLNVLRKCDVIYCRVEWKLPKNKILRKKLLQYIANNPIIVWEFNTIPDYGRFFGQSDEEINNVIEEFRKYSGRCDLAICVSNAIEDYVKTNIGIKNIVTITNGTDTSLFYKEFKDNQEILNVVWMGSADIKWNNLDLLIDAAKIINDDANGKDIKFHIIGGGFTNIEKLPSNVSYHGSIKYSELPSILKKMDIGLILYKPGPAEYGSPLKLYDYLGSGLAVISTWQPQVHCIFSELGQTDLMISHDRVGELVDAIYVLNTNRQRLKKLSCNGRALVEKYYNWEYLIKKAMNEIEKIKH